MSGAILLLGSNLGDSYKILEETRKAIAEEIGSIEKPSKIYLTQAWGYQDQPPFLNQAIQVSTTLSANKLLNKIDELEKKLGRVRMKKWRERIIDIDIIYFDDLIVNEPNLKIPHPEMQNRKFVMVPVTEIAAKKIHPQLKISNQQILSNIKDPLEVAVYHHQSP